MLDDKDTVSMMKWVNENSDYLRIGEYIIYKFNVNITPQESKKLGEFLMWQMGYSKKEVLSGLADDAIRKLVSQQKTKENSIRKENETVKNPPLKTKKVKINKKKVVGVLASFMAVAAIYSFAIKPTYTTTMKNMEVSKTLGMMASEIGSDDYKYGRNIVSQNTYHASRDDSGYPVIAYHNDGIAKDIIKVCTKDASLFDLCMYNVYYNMDYNKLKNMDEVVKWLNIYSKDDESLQFIQDKLFNCDVFLDYIISRGFADPNDKEYYQLLEDIENYKKSNDTVPLYSLSKEAQKRIKGLIKEYKENRDNLYSEYKDNLEQGDTYGTRS